MTSAEFTNNLDCWQCTKIEDKIVDNVERVQRMRKCENEERCELRKGKRLNAEPILPVVLCDCHIKKSKG